MEKEVSVQWMVFRRPIRCLDGSSRKWERLSPADSSKLEIAFEQEKEEIDLQFGRYTASASGRWMQAYYWKENKWPLVRGTWFWKDPTDGTICPFGEADAATIEEAFRDISSGAEEGPIDCELVDTDIVSGTVQFVREKVVSPVAANSSSLSLTSPTLENVTTKMSHCLYRQVVGSTRADRVETFRGYPVDWESQSEEKLEPAVSHLVLVVHGIGEALHNRQNDPLMGSLRFRGHCDLFRENLNKRLVESGDKTFKGRIEVLPVEWAECIHNNTLDRRIESVTIPNLYSVRDFANLALSDVFLYTQSEIKEKISKFIKIRVKNILKRFMAKNSTYEIPIISFVGHSLGSVVLYDMFNGHLARQESKKEDDDDSSAAFESIKPAGLFFVGSPLALFQTIRDPSVSESPRHVMDLPCRLFNIFHPYDAIAYRLEPLIDTRMKDVEPMLVPHRGGHRVHVALRRSMTEIRSAIASFSEWVYSNTAVIPAALAQPVSIGGEVSKVTSPVGSKAENEEIRFVKMINYNERIDYVLQESAVESVSEWVAAVGSHFTYWRHEDVYSFIVSKLIFISKNRSNLDFI